MTSPADVAQKETSGWPTDLKRLEILVFLDAVNDFPALQAALAGVLHDPAAQRHVNSRVVLPDPESPFVARLSIRDDASGATASFIAFARDQGMSDAAGAERARKAWELLQPFSTDKTFYAMLDVEYELDQWRPVAALPTPMPGLVPDLVGVPLLTGFDLEFADSKQPLNRLSVRVYPALGQLTGSLAFYIPVTRRDELLLAAREGLETYRGMLVQPAK